MNTMASIMNNAPNLKDPKFLGSILIVIFVIILMIVLFYKPKDSYSVPDQSNTVICKSICGSGAEYYNDPNNPKDILKYTLKDYYIKSAYNCCATGAYKNADVTLDMLKYVLNQGVRGLDFAIYSIDGQPVVATSSKTNNEKTSSNSINFADIMQLLEQYAFSSGTCPNPKDPLFINLRIYSTSTKMIKVLGDLINKYTKLFLGNKYSFDNQDDIYHNFGNVYLSDLAGKIVLFIQKTPIIYDNAASTLFEYINMISETDMFYALNYYNVENTRDSTYLINHNKQSY